jgi:hypothetical protein
MKKMVVFTLVLLTVSVSAHAMTVSQEWDKTYWGSGHDEITAIQQTMDGGYIVAGYTASFGVGNTDIWILKLNVSGDIAWQKTYGTSRNGEIAHSIQQTTDGGYIVAGRIGYIVETPPGYPKAITLDILVLKLDSNGNIIWQKTYGSEGDESNAFIQVTSDGGYIVLCTATSFGAGNRDLWVIKLDSRGDVTWQKAYGGSGDEGTGVDNFKHSIQETSDGGYIIANQTRSFGAGDSDIWVLKLNGTGSIMWEKTYGGTYRDDAFSIQQTDDEGYVVAGVTSSFGAGSFDFWVLKLHSSGDIDWQKTYGGSDSDYSSSIQQTIDGGYIIAGNGIDTNLLILKINTIGDITWWRTYTEDHAGYFPSIQQTLDGGYIVGTNSKEDVIGWWDGWVLKVDENGEIGDCQVIETPDIITSNSYATGQDTNATVTITNAAVTDANMIIEDTLAENSVLCYYEDPNDTDGDGIENTPGGTMASSMFLADEDNCPDMPNGPYLGTCTAGVTYKIGRPCINDVECGTDGFCSMYQEDSNGDGIGDACYLCECDFDCSGGVDANDVTSFLVDYGRSTFFNPCTNDDPCSGDVDCNGSCDADDVTMLLQDFGRSQFNNPCPACEVGDWCVYP